MASITLSKRRVLSARSIQLRDQLGRPIPGPVPLRSSAFPEGLTNLSRRNQARVSSANRLYELVGRVIRFAFARNLIIVVENPRSSLFWVTRWWRLKGVDMMYTAHQACAYGSDRPKWTVLAAVSAQSSTFQSPLQNMSRRVSLAQA